VAPGRDPGDLEMKAPLFLDDWSEGAPLHYQVQGMQQLFVTGWTWGELAALARSSGELVRYPFERHERFIGDLVDRLKEFWERVQRGEAPAADGSQATADALQLLYPKNQGGEVALPGDFDEWDARRLEAIETIKAAEERKREAENQIKKAIGDATSGRLPSGVRYTWALVERKEHVVKTSSARVLRRTAPKGK
jgi:predicted phage-related endonuclease